jgi:hypothetical protein
MSENLPTAERCDLDGRRRVRIRCVKCKTPVILDFGSMDFSTAINRLEHVAITPQECPGFHTELSGWDFYWRFDEALALAFPEDFTGPIFRP